MSTLILGVGCSRSPQNAVPASAELTSVNDPPTAAFKLFNPTSLVEVPNVGNLPDGVRTLLSKDSMSFAGGGPGGRCCVFVVGGASPTSAIVAYEIFTVEPSYRAIAFVHTDSGWVEAAHWNINAVSTFAGLKELTARSPDY